ncbi:hypothetical protein GIB67_030252 [Kingdonia uniflora]|uniref:Uncharacterized protein n=1 Tax=Kingdonia uniflora TaxID=39325 RepID=A0A7J7MMS7_9MAGN|nr:hypothetical protein GIB67_030252 [Kingdonia uniflora]
MGCFSSCFGGSQQQQQRPPKHPNPAFPRDQRNGVYEPLRLNASLNQEIIVKPTTPLVSLDEEITVKPITPLASLKQEISVKPIIPLVESRDELEEQQLSLSIRKKVTFDLNVKTYEEDNSIQEENPEDDEEEEKDKLIPSSVGSFPLNHRYQNCVTSDDDDDDDDGCEEGIESEESDLDEEEDDEEDGDLYDDQRRIEVESSESLFSLPIESRKYGYGSPVAEKEVNSPMKPVNGEIKAFQSNENARDRSQYIHSVLNPVENLTQWKVVKGKPTSPVIKHQKENSNADQELQIPFSSEPSFKLSPLQPQKKEITFEILEQKSQVTSSSESSLKPSPFSFNPKPDHSTSPKQEIAVDASLSTWLGSSETTNSTKTSTFSIGIGSAEVSKSRGSNSPRSHEDRPILGALTVEELREFSANLSPRRSPSRSPDDMPILGTVGSYWSHTGQASSDSSSASSSYKGIPNTTSKYREDKRVNWHSTPFEKRLERALNTGVAEAYSSH